MLSNVLYLFLQLLLMGIKEEIQQEKFSSNLQMAVVNLIYTANWMRDQQQHILKDYEILVQHYNVLRIVMGQDPKPAFPGQIKNVLLDKGRDLTRLIDKLVSLKYLNRNVCESNRRMVEIVITDQGKKVANEIGKKLAKDMQKRFNLSEKEALQLSELLDKLRTGKY